MLKTIVEFSAILRSFPIVNLHRSVGSRGVSKQLSAAFHINHCVLGESSHQPLRRNNLVKMGAKEKAPKKEESGDKSCVCEMNPWPSFIKERDVVWEQLKSEYEQELASKPSVPIKVTLPDGKQVDAESWKTTPYDVAKGISNGLAENTVISKVNGELWDICRPLEDNCTLELLKFDNEEAQQVFWHSSAHVLGEALERVYGAHLCYGPPIESGFYYDMFVGDARVSNDDFPVIEGIVKNIVKEKQPFERLVVKKETLLEMFKYNQFKVRILNERVTTPSTTIYKCGSLIDLCRGPHVRHTGNVKAFKVTKIGCSHWEGKVDAEKLQRVFGISYPDPKQLKQWEKWQEEAAKRDHRKIGREQELFFFHELSPGSCFFQPKGAFIYNTLVDYIKSEYRKRGYQEVVSPNIYNVKLWKTSGHWDHYSDNMFSFDVEQSTFSLKPMNCPGHCLIFDVRPRSWRELPLRLADFGVLHRNELSGALTGLTRVRRFQQDDAHIFCEPSQIRQEVTGVLSFLRDVYTVFGFTFQFCLSTRPEKYLGEAALWDDAEKQLGQSLEDFGAGYKKNPGDGAFYGPKIDITIKDALNRPHQCATIQLDFQLPIRFNLTFTNEEQQLVRPVIIHRALLGSVERMIAILTENYAGKWPFWLSPRQSVVIPVASAHNEYAHKVKEQIFEAGFNCDVDDDTSDTLNKKIRNAQLAQYNYIFVVGDKEVNAGTVNVRTRDNIVHGEFSIKETISKFEKLKLKKMQPAEGEQEFKKA
ncbi:threonine--tRNA ligase 1, cytoplasmic isoform X2 [Planococcus citri]